ncbi:6,7-dimethyl-8-ribityllumazine synthase [Candidatus Amoebophilus asiaticus]|nr:6,7-dimethyl-8-ribityllumazine synthase [Candidatus Amoebophilus asiaticus]
MTLEKKHSIDDISIPSANDMHFGIVVAEWNKDITDTLYKGCYETLLKHGALQENIIKEDVPGSFELPLGAQLLAESGKFDAIICLGCIIKGDTKHNEYLSHAVSEGLIHLNLKYNQPVIFGVLTTDNFEQAKERAGGEHGHKGIEAALTAIKMADLKMQLKTS